MKLAFCQNLRQMMTERRGLRPNDWISRQCGCFPSRWCPKMDPFMVSTDKERIKKNSIQKPFSSVVLRQHLPQLAVSKRLLRTGARAEKVTRPFPFATFLSAAECFLKAIQSQISTYQQFFLLRMQFRVTNRCPGCPRSFFNT